MKKYYIECMYKIRNDIYIHMYIPYTWLIEFGVQDLKKDPNTLDFLLFLQIPRRMTIVFLMKSTRVGGKVTTSGRGTTRASASASSRRRAFRRAQRRDASENSASHRHSTPTSPFPETSPAVLSLTSCRIPDPVGYTFQLIL